MSFDLSKVLNKAQLSAVENVTGSSIILAGAGSGKTRVLVYKVLNLIKNKGVSPLSVIMITFTNKAANEMKQRMGINKLGFIGTFHSFCCSVLRREADSIGIDNNFIIYDDDDQYALLKKIIKKIADKSVGNQFKKYTPKYFIYRISAAKNQMIAPDRYLELFSDYNAPMIAEVYAAYQKELRNNKALDFDDLIFETVNLFTKNREILKKYQNKYKHILVDEFQDTNYSQYLLTKLLGDRYQNVTVVGDFSQSIYSWRGADIKNLEKFKDDFSKVKVYNLEQNYRSTQKILDFAYSVISKNETHPILELFTDNNLGEDIVFFEAENEEEESIYVANQIKNAGAPYSSFAVLYRTNAQSRIIEEAFLHYGIPYLLIGGTRFYERKEIKDILSYLRLFVHPDDEIAVDRIKKIGKKRWNDFKSLFNRFYNQVDKISTDELIEKIFDYTHYLDLYDPDIEEDYARIENIKELKSVAINFPRLQEFLQQVALVESEYFEEEKKNKSKEGVRLMTLHQAKGLEFPVVFIVGVEEGILPHSRSIDDLFSLEEERRLFYVGITRAKEKLYITYSKGRIIFGRRGEGMKSRFLLSEDDLI